MSDITPPKSDFRSEIFDMAFTAEAVRTEMQGHVRSVAALAPDDGRKAALRFAAGILKLPYGRVRSLFYGEARRVDAHEADQIRAYVQAAEKLILARAAYEMQRREFVEAHPTLAKFSPPPLDGSEIPAADECAAVGEARPVRGEK